LSKRRVVVTGLGIVSPVGSTVESAWANVVAGVSGIGPITRYDPTEFPCRFGGAVQGFQLEKYLTPKDARRMDEFMHYGIAAGADAVADSGLDFAKVDLDRAGVIMGSGIGGLERIQEEHVAFLNAGNNPRKISPFFVPSTIINMIAGHLSIRFGLRGPNCHWRGHAHHPVRRCGHHDCRWLRDGHHGDGRWRLRPGQGAVHPQ
jgi:3-oxoacyl-[acyl-carrier-protein] synthase II